MRQHPVVCTDRGQHGETKVGAALRWDGEHIEEVLVRRKQTGLPATPGVSPTTVETLESARSWYEGEERWKWRCCRCRRDVRISGEHLRAWLAATKSRTLDISLLPN